ncbi:MAG: GIY-YIG nuclease family protein [Candidatus Wildermuthbacteria bacterium]|nr:GIY-YIG nuclease family protein [Candidatus Wildermuthbacteria bacterium]
MYLYLIQSKKDLSFYIGTTTDLQRRLKEHNAGLSTSTKHKTPWVLIYVEWYRSKKDTLMRELRLKKHKGGWRKMKERIENSILSEQN